MKIFAYVFLLFSVNFCYGQKENSFIKGHIANYFNQPLHLYQCYGDTLLLADSTSTDNKGEFSLSPQGFKNLQGPGGMYKIVLQRNQFFYVLNDKQPVEIKTLYQTNAFYNIASDSLLVLKSEVNRQFYEFQRIQMQLNVANYWLLQMMRLYPLPDPFHKQIEDEYLKRYAIMNEFIKKIYPNPGKGKENSRVVPSHSGSLRGASLVSLAYYQPILPDWKQPDPWRDSIIAQHFFDYFNPADSFYLRTNILPEKMDNYIALKTNKRDSYGQPVHDEVFVKTAAHEFLEKTKSNRGNFDFCLNYLLKKLNKEKMYDALFSVYDKWVYEAMAEDCEQTNPVLNKWREKVSVLRNIQIGSVAPDFEIEKGKLSLSSLQSDYTLLLFWATWCPHCVEEIPKIRDAVNQINEQLSKKGKKLMVAAVSLDTSKEQWQKFINEKNLMSFINFSEYKSWQSEVVKKYNVYATPTMFILDKNKKIIAKPETAEQLIHILTAESTTK